MVFVRQLVAAGFLGINIQKYGGLERSERGRALLAGDEPFSYREGGKTRLERKVVKKKAISWSALAMSPCSHNSKNSALIWHVREMFLPMSSFQIPR